MRIINILMVYCLMQMCSCTLNDSLCEEKKLREAMYKKKPKYKLALESRFKEPTTSRSILRALELCNVYQGDLVIEYIPEDHDYEEDIRQEDLELLKNLRVIKGLVFLHLRNYPKVKNLSFLRSLRMIENSKMVPGANEIEKYIEYVKDFMKQNKISVRECIVMEEKYGAAGRLNYNLLMNCSQGLLDKTNDLKEKNKELEMTFNNLTAKSNEFLKKIETLQTTEKKDMVKIKKLEEKNEKQDVNMKKFGAEKMKLERRLGVKLVIIYSDKHFSPASSPDIEERGRYEKSLSFIKFHIRGIRPGFSSFKELHEVLKPLFTGEIDEIFQWRGLVSGKTVAAATSKDKDELMEKKQTPFCDVNGTEFSLKDAKPSLKTKTNGGYFICGGGRRTVLTLP